MNLLNIFVVLRYYKSAHKNERYLSKNKLTQQQFDNDFVCSQIAEIFEYRQSALHWNTQLMLKRFIPVFTTAMENYRKISSITGVRIHDQGSMQNYIEKIQNDFSEFQQIERFSNS
jgi:hypothetical protein